MDKLEKKPELLIPAGSLEVLETAVRYGADAVYIGGEAFSLRAKAKNFDDEDLKKAIEYAHAHGVHVHVTANIFAHNYDFPEVEEYLKKLKSYGPDALIISDPGIFMAARRICPEIDIHISTQSNSTNYETFRFWHDLGAKRVVAARELSLREVAEIREKIPEDMEIECFVHGAMCISYSGRCLLSNYFTGRDANRGACTHPCRWKYSIAEETRPGEYLPVYENERGTYIFNSRDLCMIEHIPELVEDFTKKYPLVTFQVWEGEGARMLELLDSHIIEIAITRTQVDNASYESIILPDEPLVLAMHKSFCDDDKSEFVHIQDLKDKPLLVPLRWKTAFMSHCQKAKFEPNILSVSDSQIQNMLWTQRGIGISLVPLSARSLMRSDDIVFKHLEEAEIYTHTVVSWLKSRTLSSSCQHFIEMFRQKYVK